MNARCLLCKIYYSCMICVARYLLHERYCSHMRYECNMFIVQNILFMYEMYCKIFIT